MKNWVAENRQQQVGGGKSLKLYKIQMSLSFLTKKCYSVSTRDHCNKDKLTLLNVVKEPGGRRSRKSSAYSERSQLLSSDSNVTIDELKVITPQQNVMEWLSLDESNSKNIEETNDEIIEKEFSYPKEYQKEKEKINQLLRRISK